MNASNQITNQITAAPDLITFMLTPPDETFSMKSQMGPNHLTFSQVINNIAGDDDEETYSHNITVNKQVITRDTCTQTESIIWVVPCKWLTITDTDGKTYSIADIIDMDLPELIELKQKVPDLEIIKNFFNFLYRNYEVLYKGSQIIRRRGDTERIHITPSLFEMRARIPRRTTSTFWIQHKAQIYHACQMELLTPKEKKDFILVRDGIIDFREHINKETGESWIEVIDLQNSYPDPVLAIINYTCPAAIRMEKGQVLFQVPRSEYSIGPDGLQYNHLNEDGIYRSVKINNEGITIDNYERYDTTDNWVVPGTTTTVRDIELMNQNERYNLADLVYSHGNLLTFIETTDTETMEEYTQIYYNSSPVATNDRKLHITIIKFREGIEIVKILLGMCATK